MFLNTAGILAWGMPSMPELLVLAAFGLLLFGKRLPEVGRNLGKGIIEFKKGLKSVEDDIEAGSNAPPPPSSSTPLASPNRPALPNEFKFDPMTGEPIKTAAEEPATVAREPQKPAYRFDPYTGQPISQS
jgi:sec-independent protein translocase protein TatA